MLRKVNFTGARASWPGLQWASRARLKVATWVGRLTQTVSEGLARQGYREQAAWGRAIGGLAGQGYWGLARQGYMGLAGQGYRGLAVWGTAFQGLGLGY